MKLLKNLFSPRKLILFSLVFVFSLGIFLSKTGQVRAVVTQATQGSFDGAEIYKQAVRAPDTNLQKWTSEVGVSMMRGIADWTICLYSCDNTTGGTPHAMQGILSAGISSMYTQPMSSVEYIADVFQTIGLTQPAYAQGVGEKLIHPAFDLWKDMRNVAYVFFVVIFVAIGFMVMFRFKINPQTVATIQDSIPKIAIALLLVTLSYAIVGLFVDLAYLGNALIASVLTTGGGSPVFKVNNLISYGMGGQTTPSAWPVDILSAFGGAEGIAGLIIRGMGGLLTGALGINAGFPSFWDALFALVIAVTVVSSTFKIFLALLTKYVTLIVMVIFLPLAILWGALPGQEDTGPKVLKSILSAALAFPAMMFVLALIQFFAKGNFTFEQLPPFYTSSFGGIIYCSAGPMVGGVCTTPGAVPVTVIQNLVALGLLMMAASVPSAIDDLLAVKPSSIGASGEQLGGALRKLPIIGSFLG